MDSAQGFRGLRTAVLRPKHRLELLFERQTDYGGMGKALRIAPRGAGRAGEYPYSVREILIC